MCAQIESRSLIMEIDTGASLSIISEQMKEKPWPSKRLLPTTAKLRTYSGEELPVKGTMKVKVLHKGHQNVELSLIVVNGQGPSLLGRDWMDKLKLNWQEVHQVKCSPLQEMFQKYRTLFTEGIGTWKNYKAKILVDRSVPPRFCRA